MVAVPHKYARLNKADLNKIQALEKELDKIILAYETESPFAELNEDQLAKIRRLETELNVVLIAYKP